MKCRNCVNLVADWCDMKTDSPDPDLERECHWFAHALNYDRVMSMTAEELASFITEDLCELLCGAPLVCDKQCKQKMLDWLKQEAKRHDNTSRI